MDAIKQNTFPVATNERVALMILAAGASTRLGRPKQLLPFRGRSLLRHAAETALASVCRPVVVVLGALAEQMTGELGGLPVTTVVNTQWEEGMGSSIRAGLDAVLHPCPMAGRAVPCPPPGAGGTLAPPPLPDGGQRSARPTIPMPTTSDEMPGAVVIMLCDQPLVSAQFLDRLVAVYRVGGWKVVAAEYGGTGGVPALFSRACYPDLAQLRGSGGAKRVILKYAADASCLPLPEATMDVDQEADVEQLRRFSAAD